MQARATRADDITAEVVERFAGCPDTRGATESTVPGPFYVPGAASRDDGASIASEPAGMPAWVHGRVLDLTDAASPYSDSDTVSAVKPTLLRTFVERNPLDPARPPGLDGPWCSVETDIVLAGATGD